MPPEAPRTGSDARIVSEMAWCFSCSSRHAPASLPSLSKTIPGKDVFGEGRCALVFLRSREAFWETDTSLQESEGHEDWHLNPVWLGVVGWRAGQDLCWEVGTVSCPSSACPRVSQSQHCGLLWLISCVCVYVCGRAHALKCVKGTCPIHCRMFGGILGLHLFNASITPPP